MISGLKKAVIKERRQTEILVGRRDSLGRNMLTRWG